MIGWLEWIIGYAQGAGLEILVYGFIFQYMVTVTSLIIFTPHRWSTNRILLTALLGPLVLIMFMLAPPVKAIRKAVRRSMANDEAIAVMQDYVDRHTSGAAKREYEQGLREIDDRKKSIIFWRAQLNAESATERECAVRMLTDVYGVSLEEPKPVEPAPPATPLRSSFDIAERRAQKWKEQAEALAALTDVNYIGPPIPSIEAAFPRKFETPRVILHHDHSYVTVPDGYGMCPDCTGTGINRHMVTRDVCRTCLGAGYVYPPSLEYPARLCDQYTTKPYADRHCADCGEIFRFRQQGDVPTRCPACIEGHPQTAIRSTECALCEGTGHSPFSLASYVTKCRRCEGTGEQWQHSGL